MKSPIPHRRLFALLALGSLAALPGCEFIGPEPRTVDLEIMPYRIPCTGVGPRSCMAVRQTDVDTTAGAFYDDIEGFQFEWGYRQTVTVEKHPVANPPADGSSIRYVRVGEPVRTASPEWSFEAFLAVREDLRLSGDTLRIEGYEKPIRIPDPADRDTLSAWKEGYGVRLKVEPGEGDWLRGSGAQGICLMASTCD